MWHSYLSNIPHYQFSQQTKIVEYLLKRPFYDKIIDSRIFYTILVIMLRMFPFLFFVGFCFIVHGQRWAEHSDTLNKSRLIEVTTGITATWTGSMIGLSEIWYKKVAKSKFHFFNDNNEWLQMDKIGHFYTAYKINQLTSDFYKWSGVKEKTSLLIGTGISIGYQTTFEFFDAYSKDWGFSWGDIAANTIGSLSFLGQNLVWQEERIIPKFSSFPTNFAPIRPNVLGSNFIESLLKDYNGQTYWLSFSPGTFFKQSKIPKWACISFGYSIHEKIVGDKSSFTDLNTGIAYHQKREFLISLDIDFSRLPIRRPWLKMIVKQFNYLKIPFPSLVLRGNQILGSWSGY